MKKNLLKIAIFAVFIISFLPFFVLADPPDMIETFDLFTFLTGLRYWFFFVVITLGVIFVIYGGYLFMTAEGDPAKITKAKSQVIYALVGSAVVLLAAALISFLANFLQQ